MDQLHRHRSQEVFRGGPAGPGCGGGQGQDRAQPFSARGQQVGRDLVEEPVAGDDGLDQQGFEALQVFFECGKPKELYDVHFLQTIGQEADD